MAPNPNGPVRILGSVGWLYHCRHGVVPEPNGPMYARDVLLATVLSAQRVTMLLCAVQLTLWLAARGVAHAVAGCAQA